MDGVPCPVKEMARRFLLMSETDMEVTYLLVKDKVSCAKAAYELAKQQRKEKYDKPSITYRTY